MNCPAPVRHDLFFTIQPLLLVSLYFSLADLQGFFPKLENLGAFKSVSIVPTNATCGLLERSTFCHSSVDAASLVSCTQRFCIQECPYRSAPPSSTSLLLKGLGTCITEDKNDVTPGPKSGKTSFIFHNHKDCFSVPPSLRLVTSFTVTAWLKTDHEGVMCVAEKVADGHTVFKITLSEKETVFYYRTVNGLQPPIKVRTLGRILVQKWIHITLQVHKTRISLFINGLEEDGTAFDSKILKGQIADSDVNAHMQIGQSFNGLEQFIGRMSDFRLYQVALTNREIMDVYTGVFPHLHSMSRCRCPGSHPRVHPLVQRYCIPNGAPDTTSDRVLRLHPDAHPLSYLNDNDIGTTWISSIFANSLDFASGIDIVIDLENGEYQVFFIVIQFFSPQPAALKIQRKRSGDLEWEDWQYFARNCDIFQMENDGPLANPNSVNCLQLPRNSPYSLGNITLSILTPEPNLRPGYNNFYNTPELQDFVKATQVRIRMIAQYYTAHPTVNFRHLYYGINEITISGRCNCHGHADQCDTSLIPYKCLCHSESYTDGDTCDRCLPLFNNKPFREGDQVHAYNCRHCECFNHASSCHYSILADPVPNDHYQGGGGVCNNCLHNTTGRNCEMCKDSFYRQVGADPAAIDVCKHCDCFQAGTIEGSLLCQRIGGHCNCKRYVSGRQCNQCLEGFHNLLQSDPDGCRPCNCNTLGTINGDITCHPTSGQCKCKDNIIGLRCDRCNFGFKLITAVNAEACVQCQCDINGSVNQFCNHITGQCLCRENVEGLQCDACIHNFFGLNGTGCTVCDCTTTGSVPESPCDVRTGQCVCKPNIGGRQCNECINGFYSVHQNNSFVCLPCHCDKAGTLDSYPMCDQITGQCPCKAGVTGLQCPHCQPHMYNLTAENIYGCLTCDCDPFGTIKGTVCDKVSGQCGCRPSRTGRRCDQCKPGFYLPDPSAAECLPCSCHLNGSRGPSCHNISGQCMCQHASVAGQRCDLCKDSYFGWDPNLGRCQPCLCHPAGALNGICDTVTGQCICKPFTEGLNCGKCSPNASNLDGLNPFGCSKTPAQQPPPKGQVVNSSVIVLSWDPPDSPNSNKLFYSLRRDTLEIHTTTDEYPYRPQLFTDTALSPYTVYSYQVETSTVHGATRSAAATFRSKAGSPTGTINLFHDSTPGPHSASFNWTTASNSSGPIVKYILSCNSSCWPHARILYGGTETATTVTNLPPFSKFTCWLQACTSGGCLQSPPVTAMTAQAAPEGQNPPAIQSLSSTALHLKWPPPAKPNGIIIRYEIYMRGALHSDGQHVPSETRVFQGSGWLSPHPVEESANENALTPPPTSTNITDLMPYTEYEFRILAVNMAGSIFSDWVTSRTGEAAPVFMPSPSVSPLSSSSLKVSWVKPNDTTTRGAVLGYSINMVSEPTKEMIHWASRSEVLHIAEAHKLFHIVTGLKPYRFYNFTITLCNQIGCVTSEPSSGRTLAAAPEHLSPPQVETINSTTLAITWKAPEELNGPSPLYHLERLDVSPRASPYDETIKGVRLPGHGYYKFHSSTLPANTYFTAKYEKVLQDECTDGSDYSNCQNMHMRRQRQP